MNKEILAECMKLSFANTPFPAVVQKLAGAGVQAYTADLIALRKTYYDAGGEAVDKPMPLVESPSVADNFNSDAVVATVKAIQQGQIGYAEFLQRIMKAGCASYRVFFGGRKAMYFGRNGEFYTEAFPTPAK
jgi:uncharacterized protein YbcV (DUF1398 family)